MAQIEVVREWEVWEVTYASHVVEMLSNARSGLGFVSDLELFS